MLLLLLGLSAPMSAAAAGNVPGEVLFPSPVFVTLQPIRRADSVRVYSLYLAQGNHLAAEVASAPSGLKMWLYPPETTDIYTGASVAYSQRLGDGRERLDYEPLVGGLYYLVLGNESDSPATFRLDWFPLNRTVLTLTDSTYMPGSGVRISARLADFWGNPLSGATVRVYARNQGDTSWERVVGTAYTDATGYCSYSGTFVTDTEYTMYAPAVNAYQPSWLDKVVTVHPQDTVTSAIDLVSPDLATAGTSVAFSGHGIDSLGHALSAYQWRSSIDGVLSSSASFSTSLLSAGTHTIYFKAQCSNGVWSPEASAVLVVNAASLPKATVYTPVAPSTMYRGHSYSLYGYVAPRHTSGTYLVTLKFYKRNSSGTYVYHHSVNARRYYYSSSKTKYKATVSLPHTGKWRVRAYHSCSKHAGSYSGYDYITVK
jgi:hypothetical protein